MITSKETKDKAEKLTLKDLIGNAAEFVSDIFNTGIATQNNPDRASNKVAIGYIIETCPVAHAYKVAIAGGKDPLLCCALQTGGGNPSLVFDSSMYSVGCNVLVAVQDTYGIILGAVPLEGLGSDFIVWNRTSGSSRNYPEESDQACLSQATEENPDVGIRYFGHGLPIDTTDIGEFGHTTLTGVKMMLNPFMALMAVDDYSGLWMFDADSLVRLSGLNLQLRSAGHEQEFLNDNGEYLEYKGSVTYPWEQIGYTREPYTIGDLIKETPEREWKEPDTWKAFVEPGEDNVKPFHRVAEYSGWLGQGKYTQIVAPDPDKEWTKFGEQEKQQGLVRETQTIDGWISSIAAKGLYLGKRGLIPSVTRVQRPDDTSTKIGDNTENYNKTNQYTAKPEIPREGKPMEAVMGLEDSIAYQQNYKELLPFLQHTEDYYVPEDSELNYGTSRFADFSQLKSKHIISPEEGQNVKIVQGSSESRETKVSPTEAGIACTSDGSQILYGGCGEEVRMAGGSIFMDAPGDIWLKSGRKIILWAGDDIEIRAKGHIDVSTTEGSVRIKAESKLSMLGGNNGEDGVLIESKGEGSSYFFEGGENDKFGGILLKSQGTIGAMGPTIYLRSGLDDDSGDGIFFDANNGGHSIYTMCNNNINYVEGAFDLNFSSLKTGEVQAITSFTKDSATLSGNLIVSGVTQIMGDITTGSSIYAVGHIYTGEAANNSFYVGDNSLGSERLKKDLEKLDDQLRYEFPSLASKEYETYINEGLYGEHRIANEDTLRHAGFSFRTSKEYKLPDDFAVYESRWQNISQNSGSTVSTWEEKGVKGTFYEDTYPFPGKDAFTSTPCYVTQAWTLVDYGTGLYKDRWDIDKATEEYKNPKFGEQQQKILNEYPVL